MQVFYASQVGGHGTWTAALSSTLTFLMLIPHVRCQQPVNCRWQSYSDWSVCDGCTRTKVRTRHIEVYSQFGGRPCSGDATESQPCSPEKSCPLDTGCGDRFRCTSGRCISQSLTCNGDQDCDDGADERHCGINGDPYSCDIDKTPPNSELTGRGYDLLTGKLRAGVINTLSFGGQCRRVFSGDHMVRFRLPQSILRYTFVVNVENEDIDESYNSSWSYMQHVTSNAKYGHDRRTFHQKLTDKQAHKLIILKSKVKLAQFQNSAPQFLTLSESFWKALSSLPITYDYSAYRQLLQTYGTHYHAEGSLGGQYEALLKLDRSVLDSSSMTNIDYQRCWRKVKRRLFRKKATTGCEKLTQALSSSSGHNMESMPIDVKTQGGDPSFISALSVLDLENPEANGEVYDNWASSVKDFPDVIDKKLRPLSELVKEVQCAGLKKLHLKRAIEEYLSAEHPCHCQPCRNNGLPIISGSQCSCFCLPGTSGKACEIGQVIGEQAGVTHGSWSCWSPWTPCSAGQMSRSRSCNNPAPRGGGRHCIGEDRDRKPCEDAEIQHLQMMEPQCFSLSVQPPKTCRPPPNLRNGFILDPKDVYLVGNTVVYTCVDGFYLSGAAVAECLENQTWRTPVMLCKSSTCESPRLNSEISATPVKDVYQIGDKLSLSCPAGSTLQVEEPDIMCSPSLQWSPSPKSAQCKKSATTSPPFELTCKPWENVGRTQCVCKMPSQCLPSLPLCARVGSGRSLVLSVCQVGALKCLGRSVVLANESDCTWPKEASSSCEDCKPGSICQGGECVCQDKSQCSEDSTPLCVRTAAGAETVSECQAAARKCSGEKVAVISVHACSDSDL
ncbi:complement component C7-like [Neosynchiropus ocellatus]